MLRYIQSSEESCVVDAATEEIDRYVRKVKADKDLKEAVMTLGDHFM